MDPAQRLGDPLVLDELSPMGQDSGQLFVAYRRCIHANGDAFIGHAGDIEQLSFLTIEIAPIAHVRIEAVNV
jgi:hypothetical protein